MDEPIHIPIDGVLDLHTFNPRDIKEVVPEYLAACRDKGVLQRTVHAILGTLPEVVSFTLDHPQYGGWGATLVLLRPPENQGPA